MKILITTGIYPPEIGGPAQYAYNLDQEWRQLGHEVKIVKFSDVRHLPSGIRHIVYFFKVLAQLSHIDFVLILDTFSVAFPVILATKIFGKKTIIRAGGDFLWENYVERTGDLIRLSEFYNSKRRFSFKEKVIFRFTRIILSWVDLIVFNTDWLRQIWQKPYCLKIFQTKVVENYFEFKEIQESKSKLFLSPARNIKLKNQPLLKKAFALAGENDKNISLDTRVSSPEELKKRIASSYAVIVASVSEVSPNLVLDALSYGKPFILTEDTGLPSQYKNCGILVDTRDEKKLEQAILDLINPERYTKFVENIKALNSNHSWSKVAGEFLDTYKKYENN